MMTYPFRNPKHNQFGGVDMEINHPAQGWIPFTANPTDIEPVGAAMFALSVAQAAPADPAPADPVPETISDRQFFQQLAVDGKITPAEALAAVATGSIPAAMDTLIDELPVEQRFAARMLVSGATTFERNHPVTALVGQLYGLGSAEIDALWRKASLL